jgi:hypothetical protein
MTCSRNSITPKASGSLSTFATTSTSRLMRRCALGLMKTLQNNPMYGITCLAGVQEADFYGSPENTGKAYANELKAHRFIAGAALEQVREYNVGFK